MNFEKKVSIQIKFLWLGVAILGFICGYHEFILKA